MARIPPAKMSYPCNECNFEAQSARQLSRHKAVTHVENALKCVLCPFVTAYQTNLLRHRREVHGICGSKGNKSCKFCGFLSEDNETLIRHQLEVHRDILKSAQVKFAKELVSAGGEDNSGVASGNSFIPDLPDIAGDSKYQDDIGSEQNLDDDDDDDDKNFWKEAYEDNGPNFFMNLASFQQKREQGDPGSSWYESSGQASPPSHENSISDFVSSRASTPKNTKKMAIQANSASSNDDLPATRIRRQYTCNDCGFRTINPREFLYHRRDSHGQRLKIVECPYCVYACQYVQKLQRHLLLVHKLETSMTPPPELSQSGGKGGKSKNIPKAQSIPQNSSQINLSSENELSEDDVGPSQPVVPKLRVKLPTLTSPAMVATNQVTGPLPPPPKAKFVSSSKSVSDQRKKMALHRQMSANQKKNDKSLFGKKREYHKCQTCGYMTNVQYLFKKHMKYHSAPKIKCEMCDFESPYSWNVDRHVRSHFSNGLFKCTKCSFACDKKQALTVHMTQHHRDRSADPNAQQPSDNVQAEEKPPEDEPENEIVMNEEMNDADGEPDDLGLMFTQTLEEEPSSPTNPTPKAEVKVSAKQQGGAKKCKYCNFQTDTFVKLQKHEATAHPEKRFQCPLCEIKFENLVWLQRHLTHMHQDDTQACNIVSILDQLHPKRKRPHSKVLPSTSTPVQQNIPDVTPQSTPQTKQPKNLSKRQQSAVSGDKKETQCQVCGYQTRWISELEKHMRVHTKERPFACPYCSFKSKWKGDLNRHIQKYHSQLPMPDLNLMEQRINSQMETTPKVEDIPQDMNPDFDNDASILSGEVDYDDYDDNMEEIKMDEKPLPDDYEERPLVFDDMSDEEEENDNDNDTAANMADEEDNDENELHIDFDDKEPAGGDGNEAADSPSNEMTKSGKVKMYRCSYCDFTCSTASRFHVHFVQHLNTKPFQCSVCGHRSNWEWDVTKHIKMKSQRDEKHVNAKAMLVHESGKRDYSKYNKYVVWVNQKDAMANNVSNPKIDFRAKRARLETNEGNDTEEANETNQTNEVDFEEDNNSYNPIDPESIVITPDICFEVQGEDESDNNVQYNKGFNPAFQPNVPYNSNTASAEERILQCSYCEFKHKESKVMVSHLSNHAGTKPYRCRRCGFDSNWREVVVRHCVARHQTGTDDVEQRFRCTVNKSFCKIVEDNSPSKTALPQGQGSLTQQLVGGKLPTAVQAFQESHQSVRISGFKGSFVCDLCPFRAEKAFHMDFHVKRHQPSSGPFKCPHCPYWVNAKKSLVKHMLLHANAAGGQRGGQQMFNNSNGIDVQSFNANEMDDDMNDDSENELIINEDNQPSKLFNQPNQSLSAVRQSASVSKNRCDKCPFIAGTKTQLLYHKQFHRPNRSAQFSCTLCTYSVSYLHLLNQHMKVHYQNGDQLPVNYYELPQEDTEQAMDDERDESDIPFTWVQIGNNRRKLFQCRFCSTTSKRRTYIYVHERLHTQSTNETFKCSQAGCQFESRDSSHFLAHLNQHKSDLVPELPKESKTVVDSTKVTTSLTPSLMDVSVIDVNNIRQGNRRMFSYVCPDCPAAFKSPGDLKIHSAFHNNDFEHHCFYCSYKAKNKPQLCKHLYVHTAAYIAKRANSYPDGTKLLIGNAIDQMKRDLRSPQKEVSTEDKKDSQSGATSLLKKSGQSSPPWSGIAKEVNGTPKRAVIGNDGRSPREQMLLLEMSESNAYLEKLKTGAKHRFIYRCSHCPAVFMKVNTLTFHISMHGSEEENKCKLCSYATNSANNLFVHKQLHNYQSFTFVSHSAYHHRCTRCPAAFSKKARLEKHITLHGSDAKWKCDECDYAVTYAATLIKHRACHQMNPNFKAITNQNRDNQVEETKVDKTEDKTPAEVEVKNENVVSESTSQTPTGEQSSDQRNGESAPVKKEEKILYCCDRCPYVNSRKDSVISHLKRHDQQIRNVRDGKQCPYCDYTCLQPSYLREHIQWHFEPHQERKAQVFSYWNDIEVWKLETIESDPIVGNGGAKTDLTEKQLLFKDRGSDYDLKNRFEPPEDDLEFYELYDSVPNMDSSSDEDEEEENEPPLPVNDLNDGFGLNNS